MMLHALLAKANRPGIRLPVLPYTACGARDASGKRRGRDIMGPISGITGGAGYQPWNIQPSASTAADSLRAAGGAGVLGTGASGSTTSAQSVTEVYASVTQMLQSIGGGVEDDKLLRLLIALMILMALFENQQEQQRAGTEALQALGTNGGGGQSIGIYSSSTSISIEHTQTTIIWGDTYGSNGGSQADPGGTLDVSG